MPERIIFTLVCIAMLLVTIKRNGGMNVIITCALTVGILLTWLPGFIPVTIGFYLYTLFCLVSLAYGLTQKHLTAWEKITIGICSSFLFARNIAAIMHWPYANETRAMMLVPVICYIILLFKTNLKFLRENSFLTILAVDSALKFLKLWI